MTTNSNRPERQAIPPHQRALNIINTILREIDVHEENLPNFPTSNPETIEPGTGLALARKYLTLLTQYVNGSTPELSLLQNENSPLPEEEQTTFNKFLNQSQEYLKTKEIPAQGQAALALLFMFFRARQLVNQSLNAKTVEKQLNQAWQDLMQLLIPISINKGLDSTPLRAPFINDLYERFLEITSASTEN